MPWVQHVGYLEFSLTFENLMFVTDGIWQIEREKAKECKGKVEGWTCTERERDKITVALAWELPPLDLNMQKQGTPCQRSALSSALTMTPY